MLRRVARCHWLEAPNRWEGDGVLSEVVPACVTRMGSSDSDGELVISYGSAFVSPSSFPAEIIQHAIWLYLRFTLSYPDLEELLAERGLDVSYETVRRWVLKFGPLIARKLRQSHARARDGTSMRWSFGSPAGGCTCGAPSTTRVRCSTCSSSVGEIRRLHSG